MSDINEEQKRLYKRAEENDIKLLQEEINRLTAESTHYESKYYNEAKKVDKAIEYIKQLEHSEWITFGRKILLEILQGSDKE